MSYDIDYLTLLSQQYPTVKTASTEIIRLQSRQKLPKLTEHFMSDIHGEYESFLHILKNASGVIKDKITQIYGRTLSERDRQVLATLIYYPEQKLEYIKDEVDDINDWYKITLYRLIEICRVVASKYTRAKIREFLPEAFGSTIDELIHANTDYGSDKETYYNESISTIVELGQADDFIVEISTLIQTLAIGRLHIIGDIYDRGPGPHIIMDKLMSYHSVDIQWGNHDISWMGAACGNRVLIANVVRMGISYNNFDCLEDGYGINLRPLSDFASEVYRDDLCECFLPKVLDENVYDKVAKSLSAKMHKAMAVIQLKLIGQMVHRHPEYHMEDRNLLEHIDYEKGLYKYNGITCPLTDTNFPTVDPKNPLELTQKEAQLMDVLAASFAHSEALQRHVRFLYSSGSMYLCMNGNLLFHGCIPMNEDGSFERVEVDGEKYAGRALLDRLERAAREAYFLPKDHPDKQKNVDKMWLLWCSAQSPLFGKSRMSAFERYFTKEKALHEEVYNSYYRLSADSHVCEQILNEFGVDPVHGHIINGHVPVRQKDGENPVKADGKLYVIDGGLSKAYQAKTGIAGYTLIFNSHYLALAQHHDYISHPLSKPESDEMPTLQITQKMDKRILVSDTDAGKKLSQRMDELRLLVKAYENGSIVERAIGSYPKTIQSLHMETMEIVR